MVCAGQINNEKARRRGELKTVIRIYLVLCCVGGFIVSGTVLYEWSDDYFGPDSKRSYCMPITDPDGSQYYDLTCAKDFGYLALTIVSGPIAVVIWAGVFGLLLLGLMTLWRRVLGGLRRLVGSAPVDSTGVATPKVRAVASYIMAISCLTAIVEGNLFPSLVRSLATFQSFSLPFLMSPALIYVLAVAWRRRRRGSAS